MWRTATAMSTPVSDADTHPNGEHGFDPVDDGRPRPVVGLVPCERQASSFHAAPSQAHTRSGSGSPGNGEASQPIISI